MRACLVIAIVGLTQAATASAAVFKCRAADGTVTYQQLPCATEGETLAADIAAEYPASNGVERERLLLREGEMYKRLEAERDRLSAERIARLARPEPVTLAPPGAGPTFLYAPWAHRPIRRPIDPRSPYFYGGLGR